MTKSELVQKLSEANPHLYQRDVEVIVTAIFDEIAAALARGDRVELRGFGAFSVKRRDARVGRNPRTGDSVRVAEKHIPFFKTGKQLRDRLNQDAALSERGHGRGPSVRAVYWVGVIAIAGLVALFAASNRETVSTSGCGRCPFWRRRRFTWWFWSRCSSALLPGPSLSGSKDASRRRQLRECRRQNQALARELAATQSQLAREARDGATALPPTQLRRSTRVAA